MTKLTALSPVVKAIADKFIESGKDARALRQRIVELEQRVQALESRPELKYCGVHRLGELYAPNMLVTHAGSLWICKRATRNRPGVGSDWQLTAKRGAPGRDGRDAR